MAVAFIGVFVVALSALQLTLCPPGQPMCSGPALAGMFFGLLGILLIGAGIAVHFEQKNYRKNHPRQDESYGGPACRMAIEQGLNQFEDFRHRIVD